MYFQVFLEAKLENQVAGEYKRSALERHTKARALEDEEHRIPSA
jgi:hypothetical protein